MPPGRHPFFTGREVELERLRQRLAEERRVNLTGPAGVGRTRLAIEYAHRERSSYPAGVFWLRGETAATLRSDLASLAWLQELLLEERHLRVQPRVIESVTAWLRSHDGPRPPGYRQQS